MRIKDIPYKRASHKVRGFLLPTVGISSNFDFEILKIIREVAQPDDSRAKQGEGLKYGPLFTI